MDFKTHEVEEFVRNLFICVEDTNTRHETINKLFSKQLLALPTSKIGARRWKMGSTIYDVDFVESLLDEDEIDSWEAGFMFGFIEAWSLYSFLKNRQYWKITRCINKKSIEAIVKN